MSSPHPLSADKSEESAADFSGDESVKTFSVPRLSTPQIYLRPLSSDDYRSLQSAEARPELLVRWRFRGATPSPERWLQSVWSTTLAQFLVVARSGDRPLGLVVAYKPDFELRHAYLAATQFSPERREPALIMGVALFVDYLFTCFDLRKLYMEVPEYNFAPFATGVDRFFSIEGRLRQHRFYGGEYWDELILAVHRDQWRNAAHRLRPDNNARA